MAGPDRVPVRGPLARRLREAVEAEAKAMRAQEKASERVAALIRKARDEGYSVRSIAETIGYTRGAVERRSS